MNWEKYYKFPASTLNGNDNLNKAISDEQIPTELDRIRVEKNRLLAREGQLIEKGLMSHNPDTLIKAHSAWHDVEIKSDSDLGKSVLLDPNKWNDSEGYKRKPLSISGKILRKMANTTPVIRAIISTRQTQVSDFSRPQANKYSTGFVVRKKRDYYSSDEPKLSASDKKQIKYITDFIINGGDEANSWYADNFDVFLKKMVEDSLTLDAGSFEIVRNKKGLPVKYFAVDGETMYKADSLDDEAYDGDRKDERGYYPSHVQVVDGSIKAEYYPWDLCYGIRNATTDIHKNGYGRSELEDLINIVTWMLFGDAYNGKFFTQGSAPRGLLKVSGNVNRNRLAQFRQSWSAMVAGVNNAWKVPVIESDKMDWIDLQKSNADMQFAAWQEYLIKISCAMYKIAPEEIGFNLGNGTGGNAMFEGSNEARLKYSRDKGLRPLLKNIEFWVNKFLVNPLDSDFEFAFVGLDTETEEKEVELLVKKVQNGMGYKEFRRAINLPEELEEGDFPLNSVFVQMESQKAMQDQMQDNTDAVDQDEAGDDLDWDSLGEDEAEIEGDDANEVTKSILNNMPGHQNNPMMFDALNFYNENILQEND
jgi:hypothetical protein